jgi:transcriptional regulator with XRE-family HTH domain
MTTPRTIGKRTTPAAFKLALGRVVSARRKAIGVSQAEVAARCRAYKATVAHIEGGSLAPSLGMLVLLAEALCVEPWVLLKDAQELMEETACPPATP